MNLRQAENRQGSSPRRVEDLTGGTQLGRGGFDGQVGPGAGEKETSIHIPEQGSGKITQNPGEKLGWWQEAEVTEIAEKKVGKPSNLLPNLRNETREKA